MSAITICSDFGAPKIKSDTVSTVSSSISHKVMGPVAMIFIFWIAIYIKKNLIMYFFNKYCAVLLCYDTSVNLTLLHLYASIFIMCQIYFSYNWRATFLSIHVLDRMFGLSKYRKPWRVEYYNIKWALYKALPEKKITQLLDQKELWFGIKMAIVGLVTSWKQRSQK